MESRELRLSLKTKWFEMTKAGIKTEDYREINPYWCSRLLGDAYGQYTQDFWKDMGAQYAINCFNCGDFTARIYDINTMTLGYPKSTDTERIIKFKHAGIEIRTGNPEWGAEPNKLYFVIKHGERIQ